MQIGDYFVIVDGESIECGYVKVFGKGLFSVDLVEYVIFGCVCYCNVDVIGKFGNKNID